MKLLSNSDTLHNRVNVNGNNMLTLLSKITDNIIDYLNVDINLFNNVHYII